MILKPATLQGYASPLFYHTLVARFTQAYIKQMRGGLNVKKTVRVRDRKLYCREEGALADDPYSLARP